MTRATIFAIASFLAWSPAPAKAPAAEKLWREWYLIRLDGKAQGGFEETAERRPGEGQIAITQKWIERVDGAKSEAYVGSVATEAKLDPVAFFVERKGPKTYKTDGRVQGGNLVVTFKPSPQWKGRRKTTETAKLVPGFYFSSFVPLAVARKLSEKGAFQFTAAVEDDGDMNVEIKQGIVEILGTEKKIGADQCGGALVRFDGSLQEWWVTKAGKTCLVTYPESTLRMEIVSEAEARKALGAP